MREDRPASVPSLTALPIIAHLWCVAKYPVIQVAYQTLPPMVPGWLIGLYGLRDFHQNIWCSLLPVHYLNEVDIPDTVMSESKASVTSDGLAGR